MIEENGGGAVQNIDTTAPSDGAGKAAPEADGARRDIEAYLREVVTQARAGDRRAVPLLRKALADHHEYFQQAGDLALMAQEAWLNMLSGADLYLQATIRHKLAEMRRELSEPAASPLEKLLIDRVLACWLQLHHADMAVVANQGQSEAVRKELMKRQESAQRRYFDAIKEHAKVQKLLRGTTKAANSKSIDPLADLHAATTARNPNDETLISPLAKPAKCDSMDDPLAAAERGHPEPNGFMLDFPRISDEQEANALVNGVGVMN